MYGSRWRPGHFCGCWYAVPDAQNWGAQKKYLPQVQLSSSTTILATTSRTTLRQTFVNDESLKLDQVQYTFPLYDGVSVVGFTCTVGSKTIVGVVKEKQQAQVEYQEAISRGETAGLLAQLPEASDVFTTSIGNIPANEKILVEIVYLGELKHDAETDGSRFTIPTVIAPRYGPTSSDSAQVLSGNLPNKGGISISVDVTLEEGSLVRGLQSPSHPIAVTMGRTSTMDEDCFDNNHASATLTLGSTELDKDFVIVVLAKGTDTPRALLETHPTIPNQRALMATLVPKFNIPSISPEIVFVIDRSGSMGGKIELVVAAMKIFLKSLPVGVKFNICSFGSRHSFLFKKSKTYDQSSLKDALKHLESFAANYGGTEMLSPVQATVKNRYNDLPLEVMILTDGEIWNQDELFNFVNATTNARFFTLGIGEGASSALVEGIARAGNGFAQFVGENEKMDRRVVRMLKGALTPHVTDYKLEVVYTPQEAVPNDDDFEMIDSEKSAISTTVVSTSQKQSAEKKPISLFDTNAVEESTSPPAGRYDNLPDLPPPKVLQAPDQIPALFPFNRTTVYLIFSPEATQKVPKSVILRGTSEHGPLELEIPVQDVGSGETIHQLAAKKAIHELEQGRGWITKARNHSDDKLIKTTHEGKWDLIVEREAVRLGVEFQVGGKWCSFVAVEKISADKSGNPPDYSEKQDKDLVVDRDSSQTRKSSPSRAFYRAAVTSDGRDVSSPFLFAGLAIRPGTTSGFGGRTSSERGGSFGSRTTNTTAPRSGLFGGSSNQAAPSGSTSQHSGRLFGSSTMNTTTPTGGVFGKFGNATYVQEMGEAACMPLPSEDLDLDEDSDMAMGTDKDRNLARDNSLAEEIQADQSLNTDSEYEMDGSRGSSPQKQALLGGGGPGFSAPRSRRSAAPLPAATAAYSLPMVSGNAANLQDYQMGLMKLEQQNKNRLYMARSSPPGAGPVASFGAPPPPPAPITGGGLINLTSAKKSSSGARGGGVSSFFGAITGLNSDSKAKSSKGRHQLASKAVSRSPQAAPQADSSPDHSPSSAEEEEDERKEGATANPASPVDKMHALIGLQSFDGSWSSTSAKSFYRLIGIDGGSNSSTSALSKDETVSMTALAIAWLRKHARAEEDVWEMVVEKALGWLEAKIGKDELDILVAGAEKLV